MTDDAIVIDFPPGMQRTAEARGDAGRTWLAELPGIVESLCVDWGLTPGSALDGGKGALVMTVRTAAGEPAVLKVDSGRAGLPREAATLIAAEGRGYVRLYGYDEPRSAMLMEALGSMLLTEASSVEETLDVSAATLRAAWRVGRPTCCGFRRPATALRPAMSSLTRTASSAIPLTILVW